MKNVFLINDKNQNTIVGWYFFHIVEQNCRFKIGTYIKREIVIIATTATFYNIM